MRQMSGFREQWKQKQNCFMITAQSPGCLQKLLYTDFARIQPLYWELPQPTVNTKLY